MIFPIHSITDLILIIHQGHLVYDLSLSVLLPLLLLLFIRVQVELIGDIYIKLLIFPTYFIVDLLSIIDQGDLVYDLSDSNLFLLLFHLGTSRVDRRYIQV